MSSGLSRCADPIPGVSGKLGRSKQLTTGSGVINALSLRRNKSIPAKLGRGIHKLFRGHWFVTMHEAQLEWLGEQEEDNLNPFCTADLLHLVL